tara:strand:+ start:664 stop:927 length:264 start_codon:yes stop_codon:yes gene_type:complete
MLKESTKCEIKCLACFKEVGRQRELKKGICKECIGCVGKQSYTSKATANAASFWMKEDFQRNDFIFPYKCNYCDQWHLGHDSREWAS